MVPQLFTFGISHYCERARWALDWHGVAFEEQAWPPGLHVLLARRIGAPSTTVPILRAGDQVLQESAAIVDWAERHATGTRPSLEPTGRVEEAAELEHSADRVLGPLVRRHLYAEMLPDYHHMVKPTFFSAARPSHRLLGQLMWPVTRRLIRKMYDAGPQAAPDSRAKMEAELDRLDDRLADGRRFLAGDTFSRLDMTVASLLAIFARPAVSAVHQQLSLPPALEDDAARWHDRPTFTWLRGTYEAFR